MSLEAHINTLRDRHAALDEAILSEAGRPLPDFIRISELKRKKRALKDELRLKEQLIRLLPEEAHAS